MNLAYDIRQPVRVKWNANLSGEVSEIRIRENGIPYYRLGNLGWYPEAQLEPIETKAPSGANAEGRPTEDRASAGAAP